MRHLACWGLAWVLFIGGCRGPSDGLPGFVPMEPGGTPPERSGVGPPSAAGSGDGGGASDPPRRSPATQAAAGADAEGSHDCYAEPVTLEHVHAGRVRSGVAVSLGELVATSRKFLVSEAKSGSCLWGAFVADPQRAGAGSGLLLVSFGVPHAEGVACEPGSDGLPDELVPGDLLQAQGFVDEHAPAGCPEVAPARQLRVDAACPAERHGAGAPPEPVLIDSELADQLATGRDRELLSAWGGALVRLDAVSARQDPEDLDAVFPFGVIELEQTRLPVHSRLYYFDLSEGGPRSPGKAPAFSHPARFEHVSGVLLLDYCTWALGPRDRCRDLSPASQGCAQAEAP